mgnify:CR=1 FL=1
MKKLSIALLAVMVAALVGCNSVGKTTVTAQTTHKIPSQSTALLDIRFATPTRHPDQTGIDNMLRRDLTARLINDQIFRSVARDSKDADYQIDTRIEKISIVSPGTRILFGIMAPRSQIKAQFEIRESETNDLVTSFQIVGFGGKTAVGKESYGYDDPVREIVSHVSQTLRPYIDSSRTAQPQKKKASSEPPSSTGSVEVRLEHVKKLLQQGLITEEEAKAQRAKLLKEL